MKKLLGFSLLLFGNVSWAAMGTGVGGSFIQNQNTLQAGTSFYVLQGSMTAANVGTLTVSSNTTFVSVATMTWNGVIEWNFGNDSPVVFSSAASLMIPHSTSPPSDYCSDDSQIGRIYFDDDATSGRKIYGCEGTGGWVLQGDGNDGGVGSGDTIYPATSTAIFPFGFTSATGTFSGPVFGPTAGTIYPIKPGLSFDGHSTYGINLNTAGDTLSLITAGISPITINSVSNTFNNTLNTFEYANNGSQDWSLVFYSDLLTGGPSVKRNLLNFRETNDSDLDGARNHFLGFRSIDNTSDPYFVVMSGDEQSGGIGAPVSEVFSINVSSSSSSKGRVTAMGHVVSSGTVPTITAGCGSSPSIVGTDQWGKITVGSGVVSSCTITFASQWDNPPSCQVLADTAIASLAGSSTNSTFSFDGTAIDGKVVMYSCGGWQ